MASFRGGAASCECGQKKTLDNPAVLLVSSE